LIFLSLSRLNPHPLGKGAVLLPYLPLRGPTMSSDLAGAFAAPWFAGRFSSQPGQFPGQLVFQALLADKLQEGFLRCLCGMKDISLHLEPARYFKAAVAFASLGTKGVCPGHMWRGSLMPRYLLCFLGGNAWFARRGGKRRLPWCSAAPRRSRLRLLFRAASEWQTRRSGVSCGVRQ